MVEKLQNVLAMTTDINASHMSAGIVKCHLTCQKSHIFLQLQVVCTCSLYHQFSFIDLEN